MDDVEMGPCEGSDLTAENATKMASENSMETAAENANGIFERFKCLRSRFFDALRVFLRRKYYGITTKVALFCFFNTILPFTDVGTDSITFLDLLFDGHVMWAALTFAVMWNPFLIHLVVFLVDLIKSKCGGKQFDTLRRIGNVFIHVPFILPIKNLYHTLCLAFMGFGGPEFDDADWGKVEQIQHKAGIAGMYESFTEAGPQSVIQLVVVLCTGRISGAQWFSIPSSLLSLSWASARAYFIQRGEDESDPDPEVKTVFMRVFPWKIIVVLNSVILWTLIGGLLGAYIFFGIAGCFVLIFLALCILEKVNQKRMKGKTEYTLDEIKIKEDTSNQGNDQGHERGATECVKLLVKAGAAKSDKLLVKLLQDIMNAKKDYELLVTYASRGKGDAVTCKNGHNLTIGKGGRGSGWRCDLCGRYKKDDAENTWSTVSWRCSQDFRKKNWCLRFFFLPQCYCACNFDCCNDCWEKYTDPLPTLKKGMCFEGHTLSLAKQGTESWLCTVCRSSNAQDVEGWRCSQWSKWCQFVSCKDCMEKHREFGSGEA